MSNKGSGKKARFFPPKKPAASACSRLFSRKHGLGVPIHMKLSSNKLNINYYTLLVSKRAVCINDIALVIGPSWGEQLLHTVRVGSTQYSTIRSTV